MKYFVADEDSEEFAEGDSVIPNPQNTEIEPSMWEGIFGMLFPAELAAVGYFIPGPWDIWYIFLVVMTLAAGAVIPSTGKAKEAEKKGIPTKMVMQAGKYVFEWQTRVFPPRPLIIPDVDENTGKRKSAYLLEDVSHNVDTRGFSIQDDEGNPILEGEWMTPDNVYDMVQEMMKGDEIDEDGYPIPRPTKVSGITGALGNLRTRLVKIKGWIYVGIFAMICSLVFQHWLIFFWNDFLGKWLGFLPGVLP